jgi:hypothetical protein
VFAVATKRPKDAPLEKALCSASLISRVKVSISPLDTSSRGLLLLEGTEIIRDWRIFQGRWCLVKKVAPNERMTFESSCEQACLI